MRTLELTVPAPADLGIELLGVPEGSPVEVHLRLESVMEGVLASGTAQVVLVGECVRCLDRFDDDLEVAVQELYVYPESEAGPDEASRLDGELFDLEPALRDAVVLALPFRPVCEPECPGLCLECGAHLRDDPDHTHEESIDPRWAALSTLNTTKAGELLSRDEE
ncbi:MAG: YceD family protein [Nocardioidaceae bacterium]